MLQAIVKQHLLWKSYFKSRKLSLLGFSLIYTKNKQREYLGIQDEKNRVRITLILH